MTDEVIAWLHNHTAFNQSAVSGSQDRRHTVIAARTASGQERRFERQPVRLPVLPRLSDMCAERTSAQPEHRELRAMIDDDTPNSGQSRQLSKWAHGISPEVWGAMPK